MMKRIVIATEGSADAGKAVEQGLELASALGATVTFVCARIAPSALVGESTYERELKAEIAQARAVIGEAMEKAKTCGVDADYEILDGVPADAVLGVADAHDADLIVVGSRGLGAVQSVGTRSRNSRGGGSLRQQGPGPVSKALVARSPRPVLVVKDSGDELHRNGALVDDGTVRSG